MYLSDVIKISWQSYIERYLVGHLDLTLTLPIEGLQLPETIKRIRISL